MAFIIALVVTLFIGGIVIMFLFGKKKEPAPSNEQKVDSVLNQQETEVNSFEKKLAGLMSQRDALSEDLQFAEDEVAKWVNLTATAVEGKKETDIRACVRERMEAQQKRDRIQEQYTKFSKTIEGLQEKLKFARTKIEDARSSKATLGARLEAAKIGEALADNHVDMQALEDETIGQEAKAEAYEETSPSHQQFLKNNVISNMDVEAEVERLLKK